MIFQIHSPINKFSKRVICSVKELPHNLTPFDTKFTYLDGDYLVDFDDVVATNISCFTSTSAPIHIDMWDDYVKPLFKLLIKRGMITQEEYNIHEQAVFKYRANNMTNPDISELEYCIGNIQNRELKTKLTNIKDEIINKKQ